MDCIEKVIVDLTDAKEIVSAVADDDCMNRDNYRCLCSAETLIDDAIAFLKAQEPRVMTIEEMEKYAKSAGNGMTLEQKPLFIERKPFVKEALNWRTEHEVFDHYCRFEFRIGYGKDFRYWTAQPTDEQRRAVKWE